MLVHGWALDHRLWDRQVQRLSRRHRVVTLDLAGHGGSGGERAQWTMAAFGRDVEAVVEFARSTPAAVRERVLGHATALPPDISIAMLRQSWTYDPLPALREIKAPIGAVNADKFPTNLETNRRHIPGYEASIITGSGHYPMLEDPRGSIRRSMRRSAESWPSRAESGSGPARPGRGTAPALRRPPTALRWESWISR